jgi:hypothetical protein
MSVQNIIHGIAKTFWDRSHISNAAALRRNTFKIRGYIQKFPD